MCLRMNWSLRDLYFYPIKQKDSAAQEIDLFSGGLNKCTVLPEFKKADYLLKIEGVSDTDFAEMLNKLKTLPEIVMAYASNSTNQIKDKLNFLMLMHDQGRRPKY